MERVLQSLISSGEEARAYWAYAGSESPELGLATLGERTHPLGGVEGRDGELLSPGLVVEGALPVGLQGPVDQPLRETDGLRRTGGKASGPLGCCGFEVV